MSTIVFTVFLLFEFFKKHHLPVGQVKTEFTSLVAKSTSPGLSDTTFFACCFPEKTFMITAILQSAVILLQIVMVSPGTHLVKSHESKSRTSES